MSDERRDGPRLEADRVEYLLRSGGPVEAEPPASVWEAISAQVAGEAAGSRGAPGASGERDESGEPAASGASGASATPGASGASASNVRDIRSAPRRSRGILPLLAAAAVGALLAWGGSALLTNAAQQEDPANLVAAGELSALAPQGTEGRADVLERDGETVLRVQLEEAPDPEGGVLEVWLLKEDVSGMVTLGMLSGTEGEFTLPQNIDLSEYAVVDISREPLDGDPTHSGASWVRGTVS